MKTLLRLNLAIWILFSTALFSQKAEEQATSKTYNNVEEALKNPENVFRLNLSNQAFKMSNEDWNKFTNPAPRSMNKTVGRSAMVSRPRSNNKNHYL